MAKPLKWNFSVDVYRWQKSPPEPVPAPTLWVLTDNAEDERDEDDDGDTIYTSYMTIDAGERDHLVGLGLIVWCNTCEEFHDTQGFEAIMQALDERRLPDNNPLSP